MQHIYMHIVHTQTKHLLLLLSTNSIWWESFLRSFLWILLLFFLIYRFIWMCLARVFFFHSIHISIFFVFFLLWFAIEVFSILSLVSKMRKIYNHQMPYNYVRSMRNSVEIENRLIIFETNFYTTEISSPWFWCSGFVSISHSVQPTYELIPLTSNWRTIFCS